MYFTLKKIEEKCYLSWRLDLGFGFKGRLACRIPKSIPTAFYRYICKGPYKQYRFDPEIQR